MYSSSDIEDAFQVHADAQTNKIQKRNIGSALRYLGIPVTDQEVSTIQAACPLAIDMSLFKSIVADASARERPDAATLSQGLLTLFGDANSIHLQELKVALYNVPDSSISESDINQWLADAPVDARGHVPLSYIANKLK